MVEVPDIHHGRYRADYVVGIRPVAGACVLIPR